MSPYNHSLAVAEPQGFPRSSTRPGAAVDGRPRTLKRVALGSTGALAVLIFVGAVQHYQTHQAAMAALAATRDAVPLVRVERVHVTNSPRDLSLPGSTSAFDSATLYARQSGYVSIRNADIGSKVKAGDVLAVIAAPEIDDQLNQARAQLAQMQAALKQAQANRALASANNRRTTTLVDQGWASKQQGDTDHAAMLSQDAGVGVAQANIVAQQAQVARLEKAQTYEKVVAPFDGVITQRSIDIGSLVTADSTAGSSMFAIARTSVLRVQVYVPQDAAQGLTAGVAASIRVPEIPGRVFTGRVARTADALQAGTRTLLAEIDVDNPDNALAAGVYCTVQFQVPRANPVIAIPAEALIFDKNGTQVAVYEDGKARIRKVALAEDDGDHVEIASGLAATDRVIVSLPVDLVDGARVAERPAATANAKAGL